LPISIECVVEGGISPALANVVLPMGANVNMDGSAISFPCAILFLASSINILDTLSPFTWINIALCSSLGSVGAAPVPSAGMVTLITVWQTVFPSDDVPEAIAYVQVPSFPVLLSSSCADRDSCLSLPLSCHGPCLALPDRRLTSLWIASTR
jgi:Na+/serine symporter